MTGNQPGQDAGARTPDAEAQVREGGSVQTPPPEPDERPGPSESAGDGQRQKKPAPVFVYLAVLFAAAFLMLLMAYFIQERNNAAEIGSLRDTMATFQSMDAMITENQELRVENEKLKGQNRELTGELDSARAELDGAQEELDKVRDELAEAEKAQALIDRLVEEGYLVRGPDGTVSVPAEPEA